MRKQMGMLTGGLLLVVVVVAGTLLWKPFSASSERMSEDEIISKVNLLYSGTITDTELDGDVYRVQLVSDLGKYDLAVDAREGTIVSIKQLEKGKGEGVPGNQDPTGQQPEPPAPDNGGKDPSEGQGQGNNPPAAEPSGEGSGGTPKDPDDGEGTEPENPPMRMITREHAEKVSLAKVPGTIEDIEYREDDGVRYYLVEIEKSDGREATIQVHAITGKIMTVTWDD